MTPVSNSRGMNTRQRVHQIVTEYPREFIETEAARVVAEVEKQPLDAVIDLRDVAWLLAAIVAPRVHTRVAQDEINLKDGVH